MSSLPIKESIKLNDNQIYKLRKNVNYSTIYFFLDEH